MRHVALVLTVGLSLAACSAGYGGTDPASPAAAPAVAASATDTEIRPADLRLRLEAFAHDSMLGREAGTLGNVKATDYLAAQLRAMGVDEETSDCAIRVSLGWASEAADVDAFVEAWGTLLRRTGDRVALQRSA